MDAIRHKIAYVPEDRLTEGLFLTQSIENNMIVSNIDRLRTAKKMVDYEKGHQDSLSWVKNLGIKLNELSDGIQTLSGGNQQKVVLGRWLMTEPKILLLDEPTRGIDVGAKAEIYQLINNLAKQGMAIIVVSSELPEVIGISDRIVTFCEGELTGEYLQEEATQEKLLQSATK